MSLPRIRTVALFAAATLGVAAGPTQFFPASAASDKRTQPQLLFPLACPRLEGFDFGAADLTLTVEPDGSVGKIVVDTSSGYPFLDETFRKLLEKSRGVPGTVNGHAQPMTIAVNMEIQSLRLGTRRYTMFVTVKRGSQPRVATTGCSF